LDAEITSSYALATCKKRVEYGVILRRGRLHRESRRTPNAMI
jgi:hypothetical protein